MHAFGVVDRAERVELGLQVGVVVRPRSWGEPAFESLVEAFDLALSLGCPGWPFFWVMPRLARRCSNSLWPWVNRAV